MGDPTKTMECARHGPGYATFVCRHLASGYGQGFYCGSGDGDTRPDAWCTACDVMLDRLGDWNDESEALAGVTLLCSGCYDEARLRNEDVTPTLERNGWRPGSREELLPPVPQEALPTLDEVAGVRPGMLVKALVLIVDNEENRAAVRGERLWARVERVTGEHVVATLETPPVTSGALGVGAVVTLPLGAVLDILAPGARA